MCRRSAVLDHLIKMANSSTSPSALKCIMFCFYHFQMWLWGLKLAAQRAPDLKQCFDAVLQKFNSFESLAALSISSSDSQHLSEGRLLLSRCHDMLDQIEARSALFNGSWTAPVAPPFPHSSTCAICMDDLDDAEVRAVSCPGSHVFHAGCLEEFLVFSSICSGQSVVCCPYCRFKLTNT
jgi:hypothetical protein